MSDVVTEEMRGDQLPPSLREGYDTFIAWRDAMARAGQPLPPGGVFLLNKWTVLESELVRLRMEAAAALDIPVGNVHLRTETNELTKSLIPIIDIEPPPLLRRQIRLRSETMKQPFEDLLALHVRGTCENVYAGFRARLAERLAGLNNRRTEIAQQVIDVLGNRAQQKGAAAPD